MGEVFALHFVQLVAEEPIAEFEDPGVRGEGGLVGSKRRQELDSQIGSGRRFCLQARYT